MNELSIQITALHKRFGKNEVLKGLNLSVPKGSIFGFVGRNGAGKSTTIKAMLGLLKYDGGECHVLGIDARVDPVAIRGQVGYMAENQTMYGWMTVRQTIDWVSRFYPTWDREFAAELQTHLELDGSVKVE
ncbi:MAG: ATP-binding cassette domain-containing protein, partial [Planctomycetes bacterium]|nr:ATP-binding cassette domain-containing protein [Planctomycetota bacterium]